MDDFEDLTEEEIAQLMELGIIDDQMSTLDKQMSMAQSIRDRPGPEMRGNHRVQTAANPLEFVGQGIQQYKANKQLEDIANKQGALLDKQMAGRQAFLKGLRGPQRPPGLGPMPQDDLGIY